MIAPGTRIGRYEVREVLGRGGFGIVYTARDVELGREVAIKILKPEYMMYPDLLQRFLQEARAAAKIDHPGIVTIFDCGTIAGSDTRAEGNAFIAMQLLRGESLSDHLKRKKRLELAEAIVIARQLAATLAVAHAAGIIHRDLKPDNVFLVPDPMVRGGHRVKILDFGVAKLLEPRDRGVHTHSQMMLGTPRYMAPEQARSASKVDHRSDIYTVGGLLYEMLVGKPLFEGDIGEVIIQHQAAPVPSVRDVPAELDDLIQRMLAKEPEQRPRSMTEVGEALDAIEAMPAPATTPISRRALSTQPGIDEAAATVAATVTPTVARNPRRVRYPTIIAVGLAVAAGTAGATWFVMRHTASGRASAQAKVVAPGDGSGSALAAQIQLECKRLVDRHGWDDLRACSDRLAQFNPVLAADLAIKARDETINEVQLKRMFTALAERRLTDAETLFKRIPDDSVYKDEARRRYDEARASER